MIIKLMQYYIRYFEIIIVKLISSYTQQVLATQLLELLLLQQ